MRTLTTGDIVTFYGPRVPFVGIVETNHGPSINTATGNDVLTWVEVIFHTDGTTYHLGGAHTHDAAKLTHTPAALAGKVAETATTACA
jgi:L-ascorbate metabolism protein UlaG (beta-lactamase superfamily)